MKQYDGLMEELVQLADITSFSMVDVVLLPRKVRTFMLWLIQKRELTAEEIERETGLSGKDVADILVQLQKVKFLVPVQSAERGDFYRVVLTNRVGSQNKSDTQSNIWNSIF